METGHGGGQSKFRGCGLLSLLSHRRRTPASKESIPHHKTTLSSTPVKALKSSPDHRHGSTSQFGVHIAAKQVAAAHVKPQQVPTPGNGLSGELESMIFDFQKVKGRSNLVRASSVNVMIDGQLGNVWVTKSANQKVNGMNGGMGNIVRSTAQKKASAQQSLLKRMDPEKLKEMGNDEFKNGSFGEAVALYERAIKLDPAKASYRSNKAAALVGMGRLIEAVGECKEAVRIDPSYCRAHHRLATLYLRLGEAERAVHHYKLSRKEANPEDFSRAKNLQICIIRCSEARKLEDWQNVLKECQSSISGGADSAPKVFASQAEALLRLGRHEEADSVFKSSPMLDSNEITNFFGAAVNGYILMIKAQVDMASGRFDEAVTAAQSAAQHQNSREISTVVRRTTAVASARNKGNEHFKASEYAEASFAYGEGLQHDPLNAILLCNLAACYSKFEQWEKAIEECNAALKLRPSYSKARLRRADCFAKLDKWEASVLDYETLGREFPGDQELVRALADARSHLQKYIKHHGGKDYID